MVIYSHSRLSTFEQCPLKFKYQYIDKIKPKFNKIESHLGSVVHETLEWLYLEVQKGRIHTIDETIKYYSENWQENYQEGTIIVNQNLTLKDYFNKGVQFLISYYTAHHPFDENTLEVEKKVMIDIGKHKLIGFIDRLTFNKKTNEFEIHDYKTANSLPTKEKVESDRQLALYSIAIKELYGYDKNICLTWHYLAHSKKICSRRTNQQLEQLKKDIIKLIEEIESSKVYPYYVTKLCDWCDYKDICPAWNKQPRKFEFQSKLLSPSKQNKNEEYPKNENSEISKEEKGLDIW